MNGVYEFGYQHWIFGGIVASLLWLTGGKQYAKSNNTVAAVGWQSVALVIIMICVGWTAREKQWISSVAVPPM